MASLVDIRVPVRQAGHGPRAERPCWIRRFSSQDAGARGVAEGDLMRAFSDRGDVILAEQVTERVAPGTVRLPQSVADDLPDSLR